MALDYSVILNQPSANQQIQQGIGQFLGIREAEAQAKQLELAMQQAQVAAEQEALFNQALGTALQSGKREELTGLIGAFPQQFEKIKGVLGLQDEQRANTLGTLGVQLGELAKTNPPAAMQMIANNADVLRQAGPGYEPESLVAALQQDPQAFAKRAETISLLALGPEKFYDVTGARAKVEAQLRGQDITMRGQDIQQAEGAANRANAMNLKQLTLADKSLDRQVQQLGQLAAKETNELKRQELELKVQAKQDELAATRQAATEKKQLAVENMTEAARLATEIADDPSLGNAVGTVATMIPTVSGQTQDVINKANRLQSLLTVDNLKLMSGVLTDRDIAFLTNVVSGLNVQEGGIKGSLPQVQKRLGEISSRISQKLSKVQPLPTTPINPQAQPAGAVDVDALLNKYAPR